MSRKELKKIAQQIAKLEMACADPNNDIESLHNQIFDLCSKVTSLEDMTAIDEMVQDILQK